METAAARAKIVWKQNCLRHSFCSYAVALKGLEWTSDQADHSIAILKRDYREVVTKEDAKKYFSILVKEAESTTVSAKSTPAENFTKLIELHKTKGPVPGPVPFRPTQRDYKRQEKLMSVDSLSKITFDDGFKDEADLNGFVRWILRCQAKREAGTLEP